MSFEQIKSIDKLSDDSFSISFNSAIQPDIQILTKSEFTEFYNDLKKERGVDQTDVQKVEAALDL